MHDTLLHATYWTLLVAGTLHFLVDVVSQYVRRVRTPSTETTLYYGLHSAYSLGQVVFALFALLTMHSGSAFMESTLGTALSFAAVAGWLAISIFFIEYTPPKIFIGLVLVLLIAATFAG